MQETKKRRGAKRGCWPHVCPSMGVALCLGLGKAGTTYFARGIDDVSDEHALLCGVLIIIIIFAFFTLFC